MTQITTENYRSRGTIADYETVLHARISEPFVLADFLGDFFQSSYVYFRLLKFIVLTDYSERGCNCKNENDAKVQIPLEDLFHEYGARVHLTLNIARQQRIRRYTQPFFTQYLI